MAAWKNKAGCKHRGMRFMAAGLTAVVLTTAVPVGLMTAKAANGAEVGTVLLKEVDDISVFQDIQCDNYTLGGGNNRIKFEVPEDGAVMVKLMPQSVHSETAKTKDGQTVYETDASSVNITAGIWRDDELMYGCGKTFSVSSNSVGTESGVYYLDKGTYYLNIALPADTATKRYGGDIGAGIKYQKGDSDEEVRPSTLENANIVDMGETFKGYLTDTNPTDYYRFRTTKSARVKFQFRVDSKQSGTLTVYNTALEQVESWSVKPNNVWCTDSLYVDPGTYYFSFSGSARGNTEVKITDDEYNITLKQTKGKYGQRVVSVKTISDAKEVKVLRGKIPADELTSSEWGTAESIKDTKKFTPRKNGWYTVRVVDKYGLQFMKSIKVTGVDTKAPAAPKVNRVKDGGISVTGTGEKNCEVQVTVGTSTMVSSGRVKSNGRFSVKLSYTLRKGQVVNVKLVDPTGNVSRTTKVAVK